MDRHREMFSTGARLILATLLASCTSPSGASAEPDPSDDGAAAEAAAALERDASAAAFAITEEGPVRGVATAATRVFRGIPYAAAPVGSLRWQPPQRPALRRGVLDATQFASHCPQIGGPMGIASATENCLFLNVWAPSGDGRVELARLPVMVWIHGGGLVDGESDDYDATRLVAKGVIVVTINYRLGELGSLAHPALTAESPDHASGNYGLMDQAEALRWVRRNIALFGGDPSNVTIFGESAGGLSVHSQLASPLSRGLFHRAIVESGAYQLAQPTLADAEAQGVAFASAAGCTDQTAACLRNLTVAQILAVQPGGVAGASPTIDHRFLTQSIGAAFASGAFNRVPILEGSNHEDFRLLVAINELATGAPLTADGYAAAISTTLGVPAAAAPLFEAQYPLASFASPSLALSALGTDAVFACSARFVAQSASKFVPTFVYEFQDPNPPETFLPPVSFPYAAAHASELQFLFDARQAIPARPLDAGELELADAMTSYWATFARTGQPTALTTPPWTAFDTSTDNVQALVPPSPAAETTFAVDHNCAFWDALRQ